MKYRITTRVRDGVRDVQGDAVTARFRELGCDISSIRVGQIFYIEGDLTREALNNLCQAHLVNITIYDYSIENMDGADFEERVLNDCLDVIEHLVEDDAEFE